MMIRIVYCLILTAGLASCQQAPAPTVSHAPLDADSGSLAIRCGGLIDGIANDLVADRLVVVRDGRISDVTAGTSKPPAGIAFLDLSQYTCLPGLIDTHVHLGMLPEDANDYSIYLRRTPDDSRAIAKKSAEITLLAGFTSVRNVGDYLLWLDREARDLVDAGKLAGPRIQTAGFYLTIPHGGGDMYIPGVDDSDVPDYYRNGVARGAEEFRNKAKEAVAGGAEVLKLIASGAVFGFGGIPGAPEMTPDEIAAVVEVGHDAGIKVTAHAHGAQSIKDAVLAGVDSIEHASLADNEAIALAAERKVAFSMDVYNGTYTEEVGYEQNYPEEFMRKNTETTDAQRAVFRKAYKAGIPILFGTDASVLPHGLNARQFAVMVEHGMMPMDAIKSATSVAAYHMDWQDDVGAIEAGRFGDLVAVQANPLEDITVLENIEVVVKGGLIFKLPQ